MHLEDTAACFVRTMLRKNYRTRILNISRIVGVIFLLQFFIIESCARHSRVCRKFRHEFNDVTDVRDVSEIQEARCPPTSSPFSVYRVMSSEEIINKNMGKCIYLLFFR